MKPSGSKISQIIWDILFPIKCLGCHRAGEWLCADCLAKIKIYSYYHCPICGQENKNGSVCGYCRPSSFLDGLLVMLENNRLTKQLINLAKYDFIVDLLKGLEPKIAEYLRRNLFWRDSYVLAPIPLHRRKFLERGFNQSQIICEVINKIKGNEINNSLLEKIKYHHPQVGLSADKRRVNITGSFKINQNNSGDHDRTIILVDDVYTTGSTLEAGAKELKANGYQNVWGLVLIKGQ
ncbi:MAG: hypothetical protein A2820_03190 [Candidatus Buchananbacteria bacterium RIFCSPHIGHO2_01_FULL_40_35]|nr:MAG: hypothetical protein A2820_03190 [Candidatus Buchananbacteria bacterium RIFCSPHIGHO2_01_FULL_40_35]